MASFNVTQGSDSGTGSLREAINLANSSPGVDDIFVQTDVELNSAIEITDAVNIGTPYGATITQTQSDRIFYIQDNDLETQSNVSLFRLNLTGGNASIGGAIASYENLVITDSFLYNNSAEETGAAVYVAGANLTVDSVNLYDNQITSATQTNDPDLFVSGGELKINDVIFDKIEPAKVDESDNNESVEEIESDAVLSEDDFKVDRQPKDISNESDLVDGTNEDDTLDGSGGDDVLSGGDGNDVIYGEAGVDWLDGGAGDDTLNGGDNSDFLQDSTGSNFLLGDAGGDRLIGGRDTDNLDGGEGDDNLYGGDSGDTLTGEAGDDTLDGGLGADILRGSGGNDIIYGADGNDIIHGDEDNDYLLGSIGNDTIHGDAGNDTLSGGDGENFLIGGDGSDLFNLIVEGNNIVADFELGTDKLQLSQLSYSDLNITGNVNSDLSYQDTQIGMIMGVDPNELSAADFVEV